jgi:hypothetical protein
MITSTVSVFDRFAEVTREVEEIAIDGLNRAAAAGARAAEAAAAPGLKEHSNMEVIPARGTPEGYASGFRSTAKGNRGQDIARYHDLGTYGSYEGRGTPRRRARAQKVADTRADGSKTGIKALHFFGIGRRVGRRELQAVIQRSL